MFLARRPPLNLPLRKGERPRRSGIALGTCVASAWDVCRIASPTNEQLDDGGEREESCWESVCLAGRSVCGQSLKRVTCRGGDAGGVIVAEGDGKRVRDVVG